MGTSNLFVRKRTVRVFFILAAVLFLLLGRIGYIQFVRGEELQQKALDNRLREVPVEAKRGTIYDRNNNELAISVSADSVGAFPPQVKKSGKAEKIAADLAKILDMKEADVLKKITQNSSFVWVKRKIPDFETGKKIRDLDLPGIEVYEESQRFYPNNELACHILGFAGIDNQGLEGIEIMYDDELSGIPGSIVIEFDGTGRELPHAVHRYIAPEDGNSLVLTIDETIQYVVERELDGLMNGTTKPKSATIIVMDVETGELLALASRPGYDPNNYRDFPEKNWRNVAVSNSYEPGSTFKIITAAAAMEENLIKPGETFHDPGYIRVGPERIKCWSSRPHGTQTFGKGMENSCNPVLVTIGLRLWEKDKGLFYRYIRGFGFGSKSGVSLSGEAAGMMIPENQLREINIATIAMGQEIAVTPLQMITGISAVANGGFLMQPQLVKEVRDSKGKVVEKIEPKQIRQVISKSVSQELCLILENVVKQGTGSRAYIKGYRVAGKTGTAQKAGPGGYMPGKYVASFAGFAPANDPKLACIVVVDEPSGYPVYGGTLAAPVFQKIMEDSLAYLGVPRQDTGEEAPKIAGQAAPTPKKEVSVPNVSGKSLEEAKRLLAQAGLKSVVEGTGTGVLSQLPKSGAVVYEGTGVILYVGGKSTGEVAVPDLTGKRLYETARILEGLGLVLSPVGSGDAVSQHPAAGTKVKPGSKVTVTFKEKN
jgi:stage V sporulation protein D (sporulation-specific penicillin-binding protein)